MKLFVSGSHGQVGRELQRQAKVLGYAVLAVGREQLDISNEPTVVDMIAEYKPDVVINAAAYTAVDKAERDVALAFAVNEQGSENLAKACALLAIPLIHYSTDYVFDGFLQGAYRENDAVSPLGVYGESKLAGEQAVQKYCAKHIILRTSWVFSAHGNNFVKTMLRLGAERTELGIVADQYGKPTSAAELARITLEMLPGLHDQWGVYHLAQPEVVSWYAFATAVFEEAKSLGMALKVEHVNAIATQDYPTPAKRPENSALNCAKLEQVFDVTIKPWRESLSQVVKALACDR